MLERGKGERGKGEKGREGKKRREGEREREEGRGRGGRKESQRIWTRACTMQDRKTRMPSHGHRIQQREDDRTCMATAELP
jgi:hypothetical protein